MCRSFESSLEPSLRRVTEPHANLRVPARVYDVEGGAIFAKNCTFVFFDGFAWTPRLRSPSAIMAPAMDFGGQTRIINVQTKNNTLIFSLNPFCNSLIYICKKIIKSDQSKLNQTFISHVCGLSYCVIHSYCFVKSFNRLVSMVPVIDTSPCREKNEERETKFFIG